MSVTTVLPTQKTSIFTPCVPEGMHMLPTFLTKCVKQSPQPLYTRYALGINNEPTLASCLYTYTFRKIRTQNVCICIFEYACFNVYE